MQATPHTHTPTQIHYAPPLHGFTPARIAPPARRFRGRDTDADTDFVAMLDAYRHSGGLARDVEVQRMLEGHAGGGMATLAGWLAQGCVIGFEWQAQTWLPRFQFLPAGPLPAHAISAVLLELNAVYDAWEVAQWFARANSALGGRLPVDVLNAEPRSVLDAARRDRFIAKG